MEILRGGVNGCKVRVFELVEGMIEAIRNILAMEEEVANKQLVDGWCG